MRKTASSQPRTLAVAGRPNGMQGRRRIGGRHLHERRDRERESVLKELPLTRLKTGKVKEFDWPGVRPTDHPIAASPCPSVLYVFTRAIIVFALQTFPQRMMVGFPSP